MVDQVEKAEEIFKQQQHMESYVLGFNKALDNLEVAPNEARRINIEVPHLAGSEPTTEEQEEVLDAEINVDTFVDVAAEAQDATATVTPTTSPEA